jgi:hypothetical protein
MNIDTGKIYPSREAALEAGEPEDKLVTGTKAAIKDLQAKLFPKRKRARLRGRRR